MAKADGSTICKVFGVSCIGCRRLLRDLRHGFTGDYAKVKRTLTHWQSLAFTRQLRATLSGAGKCRNDYSETFRGAPVIVIADQAGRTRARGTSSRVIAW